MASETVMLLAMVTPELICKVAADEPERVTAAAEFPAALLLARTRVPAVSVVPPP